MGYLWVLIGISLASFFILMRWAMRDIEFTCLDADCHNPAYDGGYCVGCWGSRYDVE